MTKPKHTPLTLYAQKAFHDNGCITAPIFDANDKWMFSAYGSTKEEAEANAALICKAVNNHDKLVEALKYALNIINDLPTEREEHSFHREIPWMEAALKEAEGGEG